MESSQGHPRAAEVYPDTYTLTRGLRPQRRQRTAPTGWRRILPGLHSRGTGPSAQERGYGEGPGRSNPGGPVLCHLQFPAARALPTCQLQKASGPQMLEKAARRVPLALNKPPRASARRKGLLPGDLAGEPREPERKSPPSCVSLRHLRLPSHQLTKESYYGGQCPSAR